MDRDNYQERREVGRHGVDRGFWKHLGDAEPDRQKDRGGRGVNWVKKKGTSQTGWGEWVLTGGSVWGRRGRQIGGRRGENREGGNGTQETKTCKETARERRTQRDVARPT